MNFCEVLWSLYFFVNLFSLNICSLNFYKGVAILIITFTYGNESIDISDGTIVVTIPFNRINNVGNKVGNKTLNISQIKVLAEIRNNPNITKSELIIKCGLSKTSIDNIILILKKDGFIERIGSKKTGYWKTN